MFISLNSIEIRAAAARERCLRCRRVNVPILYFSGSGGTPFIKRNLRIASGEHAPPSCAMLIYCSLWLYSIGVVLARFAVSIREARVNAMVRFSLA